MSRRSRKPTIARVAWLRGGRARRWLLVLAMLFVLVFQYFTRTDHGRFDTRLVDTASPDQTYLVERVVDGDTLLLEGGERVRLIGVDTPETVRDRSPVEPWGPEASAFTKRTVEGHAVLLKFDKERRDRHGRLLAYVYRDGICLNEELIREGFSEAELQYPYSNAMKRLFREAETEAKDARRGIWSAQKDRQ